MPSTSAPGPVLVADEVAAVRRGVPDPGVRLPEVAAPTVLVWTASFAAWLVATAVAVLAVGGDLDRTWLLATVPVHAVVTFTMFTVLHESAHHAAGRLRWVNEVLGRLSMPFVVAWGTFPMFRWLHMEHHRNTNEGLDVDPDAWTEAGPRWQLPLRWLTIDLWYARFYVPRLGRRPRREQVGFVLNLVVVIALLVWAFRSGNGLLVTAVYLVPQRLGVGLLAWWFDWLPHHDLGVTGREDRFRATRVRVGWERLMTPVMLGQNYHLVHHIHPTIPFYRYVQAWQRTERDYLDRDVPIATAWGRELSPQEYRAWRRITQSYDAAPSARPRFHALTVAEVRPLTDDAVSIVLDVPDELRAAFTARPGQHVVVRAVVDGEPVRRTYSVCSAAGSGVLRIAVRHVPGGRMSSLLTRQLAAGDVLEVAPPAGRFVLTDAPGRPRTLVAVAAGSGITPVLPILASALQDEPGTRAVLVYANRDAASTMLADEVAMLARLHEGRLRVVHLHSRHGEGPLPDGGRYEQHLAGRLTPDRLVALLGGRPAEDEYFVCGPAELARTVRKTLHGAGVPDDQVHGELFVAPVIAAGPADVVAAAVRVRLDGRDHALGTDGEESLLDAALRAGLDAPYSCTGGACGTCRARVVEGTVHVQQDHALSEADRAAGWVLTCQSRPTSSSVGLTYDGG